MLDRQAVSFGWAVVWSPQFWLPGYLDWFGGGIALAVVTTHLSRGTHWYAVRQVGASAGACWALAVALLVLAATPIAGARAIGLTTGAAAVTKNFFFIVSALSLF